MAQGTSRAATAQQGWHEPARNVAIGGLGCHTRRLWTNSPMLSSRTSFRCRTSSSPRRTCCPRGCGTTSGRCWRGAHPAPHNVAAWERIALAPRVLRDVSQITSGPRCWGSTWPTHCRADGAAPQLHRSWRTGDDRGRCRSRGALRPAAARAPPTWTWLVGAPPGTTCRGGSSSTSSVTAASRPILVATAVASGAKALVLTVDTPTLGARDRESATSSCSASARVALPDPRLRPLGA